MQRRRKKEGLAKNKREGNDGTPERRGGSFRKGLEPIRSGGRRAVARDPHKKFEVAMAEDQEGGEVRERHFFGGGGR